MVSGILLQLWIFRQLLLIKLLGFLNIPGVARVVVTDTLKQGFEREKDENRAYSCVLRCSILAIKMAVRF